MNNRIIEKLIPSAIDSLVNCGVVKDRVYPKEFKGYISALGASIVQSGLLTTVINFEKGGNDAADKAKIIAAIFKVMKVNNLITDAISDDETFTAYLIRHQRADVKAYYAIERHIKKSAVNSGAALKLAIRTFTPTK